MGRDYRDENKPELRHIGVTAIDDRHTALDTRNPRGCARHVEQKKV